MLGKHERFATHRFLIRLAGHVPHAQKCLDILRRYLVSDFNHALNLTWGRSAQSLA
jgi:hypothetical protein